MGDRTIAPSPGRLQRAWRGGVRPGSQWLVVGALTLAVAVILDGVAMAAPESVASGAFAASVKATLADPHDVEPVARAFVGGALRWAGSLAALVLVGIVLVALVSGTLGPVDRAERGRLAFRGMRTSGLALVGIALAAIASIVVGSIGVVAAGARAVDASPGGLVTVWHGWCVRTLALAGLVLLVAGALELWLARRGRTRALTQSIEEAREELRRRGGRHA